MVAAGRPPEAIGGAPAPAMAETRDLPRASAAP